MKTNKKMKWKSFRNEMPEFNVPIFVYKENNGLYSFFKKGDDIARCRLVKKIETTSGVSYGLQGYDYKSLNTISFNEKDFLKMKWIEIPRP